MDLAGTLLFLTRKDISSAIKHLGNIAEGDYLKSRYARRLLNEFDYKRQWHSKKGKGFGRDAKKRSFKKWYDKTITTKNCVYAFWNGKRCLYIGRTLNGKGDQLLILKSTGSAKRQESMYTALNAAEIFHVSSACSPTRGDRLIQK